ncbi:hypothetical protein [Gilvibacter sp.]|uniref:hypothetical protein n=1 Tax=Gilvibacter sp. TaxID=2729997 RepID=UPI0035BE50D4
MKIKLKLLGFHCGIFFMLTPCFLGAQTIDPFPVSDLNLKYLFSQVKVDSTTHDYGIISYEDFTRGLDWYGSTYHQWLSDHPDAIYIPVSYAKSYFKEKGRIVIYYYGWIVDGEENLSIHLVENGVLSADALKKFKTLEEYTEEELLGYAKGPEIEFVQLIEQELYDKYYQKLVDAERSAKSKNLGIWKE